MRTRNFFLGSVFLAALTAAPAASACMCYPPELQKILGLNYQPVCTICHNNPNGGPMTATTNFGLYMNAKGADGIDTASLDTAIAADAQANHISNTLGINITDIEALMMHLDPNDPVANAPPPAAGPAYGCGAHVSPSTGSMPTKGLAALAVLLGVAVARASRRAREWPCRSNRRRKRLQGIDRIAPP